MRGIRVFGLNDHGDPEVEPDEVAALEPESLRTALALDAVDLVFALETWASPTTEVMLVGSPERPSSNASNCLRVQLVTDP